MLVRASKRTHGYNQRAHAGKKQTKKLASKGEPVLTVRVSGGGGARNNPQGRAFKLRMQERTRARRQKRLGASRAAQKVYRASSRQIRLLVGKGICSREEAIRLTKAEASGRIDQWNEASNVPPRP